MTGHKHVPPSRDREPATERFKRVYNEQMQKPSQPKKRGATYLAGWVFAALLVGTLFLCVIGTMVWLVKWIGSML